MGIYTSNRYFNEAYDWASEIPANEAYDAAFGCAHILADCQTNDMALFESTIYSDFAEVRAVQEGYGYVNENAFTDVIKKIVEAFKKLLAKIKGIFAAFIAKLTGAFKNGKDLVKKYEKQIIKYSNWKDFKCKGVRKPTNGHDSIAVEIGKVFKYSDTGTGIIGDTYKITIKTDNSIAIGPANGDGALPDNLKTADKIKDADTDDIKNWAIGRYIAGPTISDYKELHTEIMDYLFEDEDTLDGDDDNISGSYFSKGWIKTILNDSEKTEKEIKKFNKKLEDNINKIIDNLNKTDNDLAKFMSKNNGKNLKNVTSDEDYGFAGADSGGKKIAKTSHEFKTADTNADVDVQKFQGAIHALQKLAGNEQEVITKVTSEYMTIFKFALAQARKVWSAAAAWSSGVHKESVEYAQAVGESAAEQFYTNMEAVL